MNSKLWIRKALTMCSLVATLATYSMVALASPKAVGELTVTGNTPVIVNGQPAESGRTILPSSTISTSDGSSATINLAKAGKIQLAPATTFILNFDNTSISGELASGSITILNAANSVTVKLAGGKTLELAPGETASAGTAAAKQDDDDDDDKGNWWIWALIVGGAAVAAITTAMVDNDNKFGNGGIVISPTR